MESKINFKNLILWSMIFLLLISNIALLIYVKRQKQIIYLWKAEKIQRQQDMQKQALEEIGNWQAELSCYPALEKSLKYLQEHQNQRALNELEPLDLTKFPIVLYLRANLHYDVNNYSQALQDVKVYLDIIPTSIQGHLLLAQIYIKLDQNQQAIICLEKVQEQTESDEVKELLEKLKTK